jgi:hypothetical protein
MNVIRRFQLLPSSALWAAVVCAVVLSLPFSAYPQELAAKNPAIVPADRLGEPWWAERHKAVLKAARSHPDSQLLLIGDSITNNYDKSNPPDENFQPTWRQFYESRRALNLGFSGALSCTCILTTPWFSQANLQKNENGAEILTKLRENEVQE